MTEGVLCRTVIIKSSTGLYVCPVGFDIQKIYIRVTTQHLQTAIHIAGNQL